MYNWRKMTEEQREELLNLRKSQKRPWHSPPHIQGDKTRFIISSACYEHNNIIGTSPERMSSFESERNVLEKAIKSDRHFWAALNYIHHNPVKHGYCERWTDWPYSSANEYLERTGREQALKIWKEYDISQMGKDWD